MHRVDHMKPFFRALVRAALRIIPNRVGPRGCLLVFGFSSAILIPQKKKDAIGVKKKKKPVICLLARTPCDSMQAVAKSDFCRGNCKQAGSGISNSLWKHAAPAHEKKHRAAPYRFVISACQARTRQHFTIHKAQGSVVVSNQNGCAGGRRHM